MAAPIVYRWDDGNAPVARGERRSLCDILHACLVTGYGSKPAAGWTREFVNATFDKAVFRAPAGKRFFLQVDGFGAAQAYQHKLTAYEAMTGLDTGVGPFSPSYQYLAQTSAAANATARPWVLIADDKFFYFMCWHSDTTSPVTFNLTSGMCFGDFKPRKPDDAYSALLAGNSTNLGAIGALAVASSTLSAATSQSFAIPRAGSGAATPVASYLIRGGGPANDNQPAGSTGLTWASGDPVLVSRPHIGDTVVNGLRGFLPGYYYPCHPLAFGNLATVSQDGKNFLSLRHYTASGHTNSFISLDDWWT